MNGTPKSIPMDIAAPFKQPPSRGLVQVPKHVPVYLPELYPIPDAQEFNPSGSASTAAVQTDIEIALTPTIFNGTNQIPKGAIGVIRGFSIYITNMLTTTTVSWTLRVNGAPAGGYGALTMFPRAQSFVGNSFDCFIRIPNGAVISVTYSNPDGGTYVVGASISGWYWPEVSGKRWLEEGA